MKKLSAVVFVIDEIVHVGIANLTAYVDFLVDFNKIRNRGKRKAP